MRDIDSEPNEETLYECFQCGSIISAKTSPGHCPDCNGPLRNRQMPFE
ncbi:rubrerythrin-like domain-containing protein [Halalkalicoccus subterraneus]|nr:rubrerythrin-like domain-containing protein [Halalkalicoccus subterraneus]